MKRMFVAAALAACQSIEPVSVHGDALSAGPVNCDPATPPQCMSLPEAQALKSSTSFESWFTDTICPVGTDIGGAQAQLVPWFCDAAEEFPEPCMVVNGPQPTNGLQVGCCHPTGAQLMNGCNAEADCPQPTSPCYARTCVQNVCSIVAKAEGAPCPDGICSQGNSPDVCAYVGRPPVCMADGSI